MADGKKPSDREQLETLLVLLEVLIAENIKLKAILDKQLY